MRLSSKSTQQAFARSPWLRVGSLVGVSFLLIASLFGVWKAFTLPAKTEQPIAVANYEHVGQFDYLVYLEPNSLYGLMQPEEEIETEQETSAVFFRNIIDKAELAFSYRFESSEPMSSVTNEVAVTAVAENPGVWQKEITILEETRKGREFRVDFSLLPLLDSLETIVDDIEEEIGISGSHTNFVIEAAVNTTAHTAMGTTIEEFFSHEITAVVQAYTLKLEGSLGYSDTGSSEGVSYTEQGWFDYEVHLKPNKLYDEDVLRSEGFPAAEPATSPPSTTQPVGPGLVYFRSIIDHITASFSYQFDCDESVTNLVEEAEITAILEDPGGTWSKTLTIVPQTSKSGAFVVDFPVDLSQFTEVAAALGNELNINTLPCDLTIKAEVHTTGDTDSGHIDEIFTHSLVTALGNPTLSFTGGLSRTQPGTIVESRMAPVANTRMFRGLSLAGLVLAVFAFLFVLHNSRQARAVVISGVEEEALQAKRKHKGVIVDVSELPPTGAGEVVIPIGSVDELVRTADALLKPVLHQAEVDKHTYCVIDGATRYQYINQPEDSGS
jgi:hypothetical protein